jgi:hypothetical protein
MLDNSVYLSVSMFVMPLMAAILICSVTNELNWTRFFYVCLSISSCYMLHWGLMVAIEPEFMHGYPGLTIILTTPVTICLSCCEEIPLLEYPEET